MAVETAGHLPYELAYDRFPGHNTTEWELLFERMKTIGVKLTKTHKATGKAAVERFFGTLQDVILHMTNIITDKESSRGNSRHTEAPNIWHE